MKRKREKKKSKKETDLLNSQRGEEIMREGKEKGENWVRLRREGGEWGRGERERERERNNHSISHD